MRLFLTIFAFCVSAFSYDVFVSASHKATPDGINLVDISIQTNAYSGTIRYNPSTAFEAFCPVGGIKQLSNENSFRFFAKPKATLRAGAVGSIDLLINGSVVASKSVSLLSTSPAPQKVLFFALTQGWNMVSFPAETFQKITIADYRRELPEVMAYATGPIWVWDKNQYVQIPDTQPLLPFGGYWVYSTAAARFLVADEGDFGDDKPAQY